MEVDQVRWIVALTLLGLGFAGCGPAVPSPSASAASTLIATASPPGPTASLFLSYPSPSLVPSPAPSGETWTLQPFGQPTGPFSFRQIAPGSVGALAIGTEQLAAGWQSFLLTASSDSASWSSFATDGPGPGAVSAIADGPT